MKNVLLVIFLYLISTVQGQSVRDATQLTKTPYDARDYMACDNSTVDTKALNNLLTKIGTTQARISLPNTGQCKLGTIRIPGNVTLDVLPGGGIQVVTGQTVTILGSILPTTHQIFYNALGGGQGTVDFTLNTQLDVVHPEWWGASPSASAAINTPALQAAEWGAFGTKRINGSGLDRYNKTLYLNGNFHINGEPKFYSVHPFKVNCNARLSGGITQTAANDRIIDGQSIAYGSFDDCQWNQTAGSTNTLIDLDYNGTSTPNDLRPQFIDFNRNSFGGGGNTDVGVLIAKSGSGAQGSNIYCWDCSASGFSGAAWQAGGNNTGRNAGRFYAQNALDIGWYGGDIQASPLYGIAGYGAGYIFMRDVTFENGFTAQTGFDQYCEAPQGDCTMDNVRSESRRLVAGGGLIVTNSGTVDQHYFIPPGQTAAVGTIIGGSILGDGHYYKVTVDGGAMGGVGTPSTPEAATSGSATTIVKSSATYTPNAFVGYQVSILGGTGQGQTCVVTGNTATTITCSGGWATAYPLTTGSPDNTSTYIIEPNWGTQTASGGMTWADLNENGIEGSAGQVSQGARLQNVSVPGEPILAIGLFRDIYVTRTDWISTGFPLDDDASLSRYEGIIITPALSRYHKKWSFPRNSGGSVFYSGDSQENLTYPLVWSIGERGGGLSANDVWIGGRSDPKATNSISRNILEYGGLLGPPTPKGANQDALGGAGIECGGLSTGNGRPGDCDIWVGTKGAPGSQVNPGFPAVRVNSTGLGFVRSRGQHFFNFSSNGDLAGTCQFNHNTTCSVRYATPYNSTPVVILTPVNPGASTFTLTSTSSTGFTVTASSSNSAVINYATFGNPN